MDYKAWANKTDDELRRLDVGRTNLLLAEDLPQSQVDIDGCCLQLDDWANAIEVETNRMMPAFKRQPERFGGTKAHFRMMVMVTVLQRDLKVHYDDRSKVGFVDCSSSRTEFIHGILCGFGGTCVTLPILYLAIGRRLGYPLYLAHTREHSFVRWDDGKGQAFNIECSCAGFMSYDDAHYRRWPKPWRPGDYRHGCYIRNNTPREELASFLSNRLHVMWYSFNFEESIICGYFINQLCPHHPMYEQDWALSSMLHRITEEQEVRARMTGKNVSLLDFPKFKFTCPAEEWHYFLACQALTNIINVRDAKTREPYPVSKNEDAANFPGKR